MTEQKKPEEITKILVNSKDGNEEELRIFLNPVKESMLKLPRLKFDGYIIYEHTKGNYKLVRVSNFKDIYKDKEKSVYLHKIEGRLNDKPFFMIKHKIPITVNTVPVSELENEENEKYINGIDLCYDTKAFDTMLQYVTISNLKVPKHNNINDIGKWFNENIVIVVLSILAFIFFTLTPIGRELLESFIRGFNNG